MTPGVFVALVLVGVVLVALVGRASDPMGRVVSAAAVSVLGLAVGCVAYMSFAAAVTAWDERPGLVRAVAVVVLLLLLLLASIGAHRRHDPSPHPDSGDEDDPDGGGGWRPPPPPGPRTPPPAGGRSPDVPWGEFDATRADWGRTPAGRL